MSRFLRFPNGKSKAFTLSYDDCNLGIIRLVEIMQKHGVKGTFNLNSGRYACNCFGVKSDMHLTEEQLKACLSDSGMEIAVHGYKHLNPTTLTGVELYREFCVDKENLENAFGGVVRGVAYAFGGVNDKVVSALDNMGFAYARTVKSTLSFDIPTDWLRLNPTCHHDDSKLKELTEYFIKTNPNDMGGKKAPMLFYVWGHANEFINKNNWQVIEELCSAVGNKDDIWCATNIEICDYVKAFNNLHFSADGKTVLNNSAFDVWFYTDGVVKVAEKCAVTKL